ncbi:MAG: aminoglycoside phosphotransferase family protein [Nocardiopsaceae bacterium]|nr:aminoglycoside phosphotransferase family protein [Nocardiopsaceae bacterium]
MGAVPMPAAEADVSPALVRRLLAAQHRDLAQLPVEPLANGWDNVMFRVGGTLVARLPRRQAAARILLHEQRWLPVLAPGLPLPVPAPVRAGQPGLGYPWPWSIAPFLPGRAAARTPPADARAAAVTLGRFLAALHVPAAPDAPISPVRGIPLADRSENLARNLDLLGGRADRPAVMRRWQAALAAPRWDGPGVWVHGDLHPANILVHRGRISGVIDFGDLTAGDPAGDLSVAWLLLPAGCRGALRDAYAEAGGGGADDASWARARGWALALSVVFLAHSADNPLLAGIGRRGLAAVLAYGAG